MLYNNNVVYTNFKTVFKKYRNRSSTAALGWYLNNFCGGGGGEEISILKCSFSVLKKIFNFTFFEKKKIWRGGPTLIAVIVLQHFGHLST